MLVSVLTVRICLLLPVGCYFLFTHRQELSVIVLRVHVKGDRMKFKKHDFRPGEFHALWAKGEYVCPICGNDESDKWNYDLPYCVTTCLNCRWKITDIRRELWYSYTVPGNWQTTVAGSFEYDK